MTWPEEAREAVARAICEEIDPLPFGELDEPHRMQARESYLADADLILTALAPYVAAEVAQVLREAIADAVSLPRDEDTLGTKYYAVPVDALLDRALKVQAGDRG